MMRNILKGGEWLVVRGTMRDAASGVTQFGEALSWQPSWAVQWNGQAILNI